VIGGQVVNAYAELVVSLDLDLAVAVDQLGLYESLLAERFVIRRFAHSLNVTLAGSDLRVQIQTDSRYADFIQRAEKRIILGMKFPVARLEDALQGKVWAVMDAFRQDSKRQKDLADIARLHEGYPELRQHVPQEVSTCLF